MLAMEGIKTALCMNALDVVTGLVKGIKKRDIQSGKLRDGLFKKLGFILCYLVAWVVDVKAASVGFQLDVKILPVVLLYVYTTEFVSNVENLAEIIGTKASDLLELFHIKKKEEE